MTEPKCGTVAVYDLGGGTFDVSILELQDGIYQVLATAGDTYLGGEDFDELIVRWLIEEFRREHGIDVSDDRMARQRLKGAAEKAKCELSTQPQAEIVLPFLSADRNGPKHLSAVLPRARFEAMIRPMLEHTAALCREALREAGLKPGNTDEVVPVGGQTRFQPSRDGTMTMRDGFDAALGAIGGVVNLNRYGAFSEGLAVRTPLLVGLGVACLYFAVSEIGKRRKD